jgi:hypothetical protein
MQLIDKQAAYAELKHEAEMHMLPEYQEAYARAARLIDRMKPVDAKPVAHACWVGLDDDKRGFASEYLCSNCDSVTYLHICERECDYDYCPYCGARMDGDEHAE